MSAAIASTFDIVVEQTLQGAAIVLTNPGRTFRLTQVLVTGGVGCGVIVRKNTAAGAIVAGPGPVVPTGNINDFPLTPSALATATFLVTDNLYVEETQNVAASRIILRCTASDPEAVTVSDV